MEANMAPTCVQPYETLQADILDPVNNTPAVHGTGAPQAVQEGGCW